MLYIDFNTSQNKSEEQIRAICEPYGPIKAVEQVNADKFFITYINNETANKVQYSYIPYTRHMQN